MLSTSCYISTIFKIWIKYCIDDWNLAYRTPLCGGHAQTGKVRSSIITGWGAGKEKGWMSDDPTLSKTGLKNGFFWPAKIHVLQDHLALAIKQGKCDCNYSCSVDWKSCSCSRFQPAKPDKNHGPWNSTFEPVAWKFQFFLEMSRVGGDDEWSVLWIYAVY